jgi:hypothetical protein
MCLLGSCVWTQVKWSQVADQLPGRIGKQCRERWFNHLDKAIVKTDWWVRSLLANFLLFGGLFNFIFWG